ncbi:unnamed protein product [Prorocentrum cordatum]|uniref:Uncharacterized protein n=1 Tax=Prorocentrum cordatum TaxID=2364126 RepID=A0ABN9T4H3_9DINO|nr:unnamed protein product [Polarella glacialis]
MDSQIPTYFFPRHYYALFVVVCHYLVGTQTQSSLSAFLLHVSTCFFRPAGTLSEVHADSLGWRWAPSAASMAPFLARSARNGGVSSADPGNPRRPARAFVGAVFAPSVFGLSGQDLEDAFARLLVDRAEVQTLEWAELQAAEAERDGGDARENQGYVPREELSADGTLLVVPLGERAVRSWTPRGWRSWSWISGSWPRPACARSCGALRRSGSTAWRCGAIQQRVQEVRQDLQEILAHHGLALPEGSVPAPRACCER